MKVYKEIETIFNHYKNIKKIIEKLSKKISEDELCGIQWSTIKKITLTDDQFKSFKNKLNNDYLVEQYTGYSSDDFYGNIYFATEVKNEFYKVHFEC